MSRDLPIEAIMERNSPSKIHYQHPNVGDADDNTPRRGSFDSPNNTSLNQPSMQHRLSSLPPGVGQGRLIPPRNMTNNSNVNMNRRQQAPSPTIRPRSNLAAMFDCQTQSSSGDNNAHSGVPSQTPPPQARQLDEEYQVPINEADSASGPTPRNLARSDPIVRPTHPTCGSAPPDRIPSSFSNTRGNFATAEDVPSLTRHVTMPTIPTPNTVRRCISSRELGTLLAPPSGSPFAFMLFQQQQLQDTMQQRLMDARRTTEEQPPTSPSPSASIEDLSSNGDDSSLKHQQNRRAELRNETRNRRRAEHNRAVTNDLVEIVTDLLQAEAKLVKPPTSSNGMEVSLMSREALIKLVGDFCSTLPTRYALGVNTPSQVLLHMRLMAAARADHAKAVVHVTQMQNQTDGTTTTTAGQSRHLVTISCCDAIGLLEYITRLLGTGGSRVIDADVMLSTDNIVLDRFVVQMKGRLRLDKFAQSIETFLAKSQASNIERSVSGSSSHSSHFAASPCSPPAMQSGPLYFHAPSRNTQQISPRAFRDEIDGAVPLSEILTASSSMGALATMNLVPIRRQSGTRSFAMRDDNGSVPSSLMQPVLPTPDVSTSTASLAPPEVVQVSPPAEVDEPSRRRAHRPLVDRQAINLSDDEGESNLPPQDYMTATTFEPSQPSAVIEDRIVPLIPFEELMLIETLGTGRVSTIYRAAWKLDHQTAEESAALTNVSMVALKVATVNSETGDTSHIDELRREADIAAMLEHSHVCQLKGVAADNECFCLAYEFCEGGSLLNLLLDSGRYYEYLPIALDIANGMAYLHSRHVIHRDLKPSNVLLTRDHRAKISDFGMSVANTGQELTAETGTYRYMSPEVIRHESYSSNADVYSFGIVLWQLIAREIPFSTMTPIQAAFAVAQGRRPDIPASCPEPLRVIIEACWQQDATQRPSFTYITMALADYARMAFSPANVGTQTLQIANEVLATVEGNSTINVDFSIAPVQGDYHSNTGLTGSDTHSWGGSNHDIGLSIE